MKNLILTTSLMVLTLAPGAAAVAATDMNAEQLVAKSWYTVIQRNIQNDLTEDQMAKLQTVATCVGQKATAKIDVDTETYGAFHHFVENGDPTDATVQAHSAGIQEISNAIAAAEPECGITTQAQ